VAQERSTRVTSDLMADPGRTVADPNAQVVADLVRRHVITPVQGREALEDAATSGETVSQVLVRREMATASDLQVTVFGLMGFSSVDLSDETFDHSVLARLPVTVCRQHVALPIRFDDEGRLLVAMDNPTNVVARDDITASLAAAGLHVEIEPLVASREEILAMVDKVFHDESELDDLQAELEGSVEESDDLASLKEATEDAPIVKWVNGVIGNAIRDRASDIHIEPGEHSLKVRWRIDGVLHEKMTSPRSIQSGVISRLKIMADMDIAERRVPQDGRLSVNMNGRKIDLRVASLPTVWGEKIVMRVLDNSNTRLGLSDLGFSDHNYMRFAESFTKPYGMILVTGPTGSGKSTTLYATLNQIARPEVNVITVEDPVEYRLPGINQVQTNAKAGLTFASALRSILRSDPDIVLIGEIRDHETAQIAVEAALTGHLVLSTLHTNDAPSAITRLIEMGLEPFLVGSALDCVLAQRLARRLCEKCAERYEPTPEQLRSAKYPWQEGEPIPTLWRPVGCPACAKTGYKGRLALHEVMPVSEEIERLAVERASAATITNVAKQEDMWTLRDDGMLKVGRGVTSIDEILRVVV
jgi:type IV pilus assembly protein PilB